MAEQQAAPAPTLAPDAPSDRGALSVDDAVNILNNSAAEDPVGKPEGRQRDERGRFTKPEGEGSGDQEQAAAGSNLDEPEGDDPESDAHLDEGLSPPDGESEGETEDEADPNEQLVAGEAKTRLRDGTVVPVAELKKGWEELQEVRRGGIPAEIRQEIDKVASDLQQRQQYLDKTLPLAIEALKAALPPEPDQDLWDSDPIQATIDQRKHDLARQKLQGLMQAGQQQTQQQQQEQQQQFAQFIGEQQKRLHEARPELKDPQKAQAFYEKYKAIGKKMGFADEELDQTYDSRLILGMMSLAEKAEKWDKLQASKPQAEQKMQRAVPMAKPGRRVEPEQRRSAETEKFRRRFDQSRSIDDAAALITKLGL
jgi:hypothetical protein